MTQDGRTRIVNGRIHRARPTGEWTFDYHDYPNSNPVYHHHGKVSAAFAAGMEPAFIEPPDPYAEERHVTSTDGAPDLPAPPDPVEIPNRVDIAIRYGTLGSGGREQTLHLQREGAERLLLALKLALEWDGN